ncbi:MAG: hypothetical protein C0613_14060 [Desulfobulbaceae bacterium]|nr:MAG: hypothetical protein C0613_14060 [Desulfobulbaceae bacterium]
MPIITLTTDFGHDDAFVAVMKGVILGRGRRCDIIDICHTIPPQDIGAAARTLAQAAPFFPPATIHVAVVDPGVGSRRRIICLETAHHLFLAPDNGLLTPVLAAAQRVVQVSNESLFLQPVSATFHGRDIFAPVAAALANGLALSELGPVLKTENLVTLKQRRARFVGNQLRGECLQADHFGNMATTINAADLQAFPADDQPLLIRVADRCIAGLSQTYEPTAATAIALINSNNQLEIALAHGNATRSLHLKPGMPVVVEKKRPPATPAHRGNTDKQ